MDHDQFISICLKKNDAYVDFPFREKVCVVKVRGKIFAQAFILRNVATITLNCSVEGGYYYRNKFPQVVVRGYHCPLVQQPHFNSMPITLIDDDTILEMIDHSYSTVISKMPKYIQAELLNKSQE